MARDLTWLEAVGQLDVPPADTQIDPESGLSAPPTYNDKSDPFAASKAGSLTGGLLGLAGTALAVKGALDYGAAAVETAKRNAKLAQQEAGDAIERALLPAFRARLSRDALFGRQESAYGASGVLAGWGSAGDVTGETRIFSAIDEQVIRNNAAREAYMLQTQAVRYQMEGRIAQQQAGQQAESSLIGGITGAAKEAAPLLIDAAA